jgi:hypothetical protein
MSEVLNDSISNNKDEISLTELFQKLDEWFRYIKSQWYKIAILGFIGGIVGFVYAYIQPITYTAKTTFVVEEGKSGSSSLGGLASLAGQFGVDVGGGSTGGLFSGDNILLYFKSESLSREVLLSKYDTTSEKLVADVYAEIYKLNEGWENNKNIGKINFSLISNDKRYLRLQDSLLQQMVGIILKNQFSIAKTDKKAGFIEVSVTMENEILSKIYCERIVKVAVDRYIKVKTQRQKNTVDKLQFRADSVANLLSRKTISGATLQTSATTMDINPLYKTSSVINLETTVRDKTLLSTIFASVIQNLELAKFTLSQETPVIQIVDSPIQPLKIGKTSKSKTAIIFSIIFALFITVIVVLKKIILSYR